MAARLDDLDLGAVRRSSGRRVLLRREWRSLVDRLATRSDRTTYRIEPNTVVSARAGHVTMHRVFPLTGAESVVDLARYTRTT